MRYMVTAPGKVVAKHIGWKHGSNRYKALVLVSSFICSGITHMGLVPPEPVFAKGGTSAMSLRLYVAAFFWIQPVGIYLEIAMEHLFATIQKLSLIHI